MALTFATLLLVALGSAACSNSLPQGANGPTPAGTYKLTLTTTFKWTDADVAEFPDADRELERGGDVEDVGLKGVAADEEADGVKFAAAAIVADAIELVVEDVLLRG